MLNLVTEFLAVLPGLKFWELVNNMKTKLSAFFKNDLVQLLSK